MEERHGIAAALVGNRRVHEQAQGQFVRFVPVVLVFGLQSGQLSGQFLEPGSVRFGLLLMLREVVLAVLDMFARLVTNCLEASKVQVFGMRDQFFYHMAAHRAGVTWPEALLDDDCGVVRACSFECVFGLH